VHARKSRINLRLVWAALLILFGQVLETLDPRVHIVESIADPLPAVEIPPGICLTCRTRPNLAQLLHSARERAWNIRQPVDRLGVLGAPHFH
jgi:hypothetical protein